VAAVVGVDEDLQAPGHSSLGAAYLRGGGRRRGGRSQDRRKREILDVQA
jgi:hypothetical protein